MNEYLEWAIIILDLFSASVILFVLFEITHSRNFPFIFRVGLAMAASGLLGQVTLNFYDLKGINKFEESGIAWWLGRDVGLMIFAYYAVFGRWYSDIRNSSSKKES